MKERILQFGEGNFLRGFAEWIINNMNARAGFDASVVIVKPRPSRPASASHADVVCMMREAGCRYSVHLQGLSNGQVVDVLDPIDCVSRIVNPYEEYADFIALAELPDLRFVLSNTTEAGIAFDPYCRLADTPPMSYPAKLTQLLWQRFRAFGGDVSKGLIILPCELIEHNGQRLHECVLRYIDLWREDFADAADAFRSWVETACHFCSTLVDRIVSGSDGLTIKAEPYHLWVIEPPKTLPIEQFTREFPAKDAGLNVIVTNDESPYHRRKLTLLNAPHTVLSPVAFLAGLDIVRDACQHEVVGQFIRRLMSEELLPTLLPESVGKDSTLDDSSAKAGLQRFAADVLERFLNPFVDHQLTSIMLNSFPKFVARDLTALKTYAQRNDGQLPRAIVLGLAAICVYYRGGQRADGKPIQPNDDPRIIQLLADLWNPAPSESPSAPAPSAVSVPGGSVAGEPALARRVATGILAATDLIWHEHGDLNVIPGLTDLLAADIDAILCRGMLSVVTDFVK